MLIKSTQKRKNFFPRLRLINGVWHYYLDKSARTPVLICRDLSKISRIVSNTANKFGVYPK
jgi:hypothetical protein